MIFDELRIPYYLLILSFVIFFGSHKAITKRTDICIEVKSVSCLFIFFFIFVVSCLYGWREVATGYGGVDSKSYREIFSVLNPNDISSIFEQRVEKGFASLMWFIKKIGFDFHFFNFLFSLLLLSVFLLIILETSKTLFSTLSIVLFSLLYIDSFNISRMIFSTLLVFLSLIQISKGREKIGLFLIFIAIFFQLIAIWGVFLFLYYKWLKVNTSRTSKVVVYFLLLLVSFSVTFLFSSLLKIVGYSYYIVEESAFSLFNYLVCFYFCIVYFFFIKKRHDFYLSESSRLVFLLMPTMFFILPLYIEFPIAYRFNYIYMALFFFIIPDVLRWSFASLKRKRYFEFSLTSLPIFFYFFVKVIQYFNRDVVYAENWHVLYDFSFGFSI